MTRQRPITTSQILAAAITTAAVLIMLTPLRRGPLESPSMQAGWMPLLNHGGLADTAAFHRLEVSDTRSMASDAPLYRKPSTNARVNRP